MGTGWGLLDDTIDGAAKVGRNIYDRFSGEEEEDRASDLRDQIDSSIEAQRGDIPEDWNYDPRSVFGPDGITMYGDPESIMGERTGTISAGTNPGGGTAKGRGARTVGGGVLGQGEYQDSQLESYDPTMLGPSAFESLGGQDERDLMRGFQDESIEGTMDIARQGGLTAIDRARMAERRAQEGQQLRGQREATLANMEARGIGGGGAELASIFDQQQSSADRNSLGSQRDEAMALQRQDQARRDAFGMSSDQRGQSFGEASTVADATDTINQLNAQVGTEAARYWADTQNQGVMSDVNARRGTQNANTDLHNQGVYADVENQNQGQIINRGDDWDQYGAGADLNREQRGNWGGQASESIAQGAQDTNMFWDTAGAIATMGASGGNAGASRSALTQSPQNQTGGYKSYAPTNNSGFQTPPDLMDWQDDEEDDR